jgi:hypothetical protein
MAMQKQDIHQTITSDVEKKALLGDEMVRLQPALGVSTIGWLETFKELLIELPTVWHVVNAPLQEDFADLWMERHGEWQHGSGRTKAHNRLGMAYAWWALYEVGGLSEINLSDSPDFSGSKPLPTDMHNTPATVRVCGDIGKCTPVALFTGLTTLRFHDVWISVINWETQVFIQFGYSPSAYRSYKIWSRLRKDYDHYQAVRGIFFCEGCNEWSITEKSRQKLIRWGQAKQATQPGAAPDRFARHPARKAEATRARGG